MNEELLNKLRNNFQENGQSDDMQIIAFESDKAVYPDTKDVNLKNRYSLIQWLYPQFDKSDAPLIKYILEQEIKHAQVLDYYYGLNLSSFMLLTIHELEDIPLIYRAKFDSCFDASFALDPELFMGKNVDETIQHLTIFGEEHKDILESIHHYLALPHRSYEDYIQWFTPRVKFYINEEY